MSPVTSQVDETVVAEAARRLADAAASRRPCAPLRDLIEPDDVHTAYRVQEQFNLLRAGPGAEVVGRKIGATSEAVQRQLGVDRPDFGVLFADMAFGQDGAIPIERLLQPRAEAEIAFILGADLADGPLDDVQCRRAVGAMAPALEVVDSRIAGWDISFADTVADNASSGVFVLGEERRSLDELEPAEVTMRMEIDGETASTGTGRACLGDPLHALSWLARQARDFGDPLRAGQVILSGALGPMRPVSAGAVVDVHIPGLSHVSASFEGKAER
ncbi:2-keto-4-pentenoate hydratase [Actinomadura rupiterrae]|uniref:2-keto-4-pentenoate hydratase n=1 Tax=Actinomadura rupiterrae TaxID=559627 RepID=UPI0020A4A2FB|nr:fumarylacetoacetate hydrolase family protein [Actinomadura rupiterrae]MCP2338677.1 2-keto-4-pentenoate hydratase [Actinomadura rupiterrae]